MASQNPIAQVSLELLAQASRAGETDAPQAPRRIEQARMRSSIACVRCRKSKVKCLNQGPGTPCRACQTADRECTYPEPMTDRSHRRKSADGLGADTPRSSKPRKRFANGVGLTSHRPLVDALDPTVLQPVWVDLVAIWERNYATDLPFIHPPTFQDFIRQARPVPLASDFNASKLDPAQFSPAIAPEFLLAFVALTSRFSPTLVSHHSSHKLSNPQIAAEYYARACYSRLLTNDEQTIIPTVSLDRLQTYLMLAVHEWSSCNGKTAWMHLSQAIAQAKLLGLSCGEKAPSQKFSIIQPLPIGATNPHNADGDMILREVKKRTFWSCFLIERLMSSGPYRQLTFDVQHINVFLPVSQHSFLFNRQVRTKLIADSFDALKFLKDTYQQPSPSHYDVDTSILEESGPNEPILSHYLKAAEVYNAIVQWACAGGRLNETYPPWDEKSNWTSLYRAVNAILDRLPRDLTLTPSNTSAHNSTRTLAPFTLLHTLLLMSRILLHREWLPFLPVKHSGPKGPTEPDCPFTQNTTTGFGSIPFWDMSAKELFRSSRSLLELFTTCAETKVLPETPLIGFATYMLSLLALYSTHWPWMDISEQMSTSRLSEHGPGGALALLTPRNADIARNAANLMMTLKPTLKMVDYWFILLQRTNNHYIRIKRLLKKHTRLDSFAFEGGGLKSLIQAIVDMQGNENHKPLEEAYGRFPEDVEMVDSPDLSSAKPTFSSGNSESARDDLTWSAINAAQAASAASGSSRTSPGLPVSSHGQVSSYPAHVYSSSSPTPHRGLPNNDPMMKIMDHVLGTPNQESAAAPPPVSWTQEQAEDWLETQELKFGAQDLAAFVEGMDDQQYAALGGWVGEVWNKKVTP